MTKPKTGVTKVTHSTPAPHVIKMGASAGKKPGGDMSTPKSVKPAHVIEVNKLHQPKVPPAKK